MKNNSTKSLKLNLGCGMHPLEGYKNLDNDPAVKPDLVWDLNKLPYPIGDESCEHVLMSHVYEHLMIHSSDLLKELYRILEPNGIAELSFPNMFQLKTRFRYFLGTLDGGLEWHPYHTKLIHWRYLERLALNFGFEVIFVFGSRIGKLPPLTSLQMLFASVVHLKLRRRP